MGASQAVGLDSDFNHQNCTMIHASDLDKSLHEIITF